MRAAVCVIGVAFLVAVMPQQTFSQSREMPPSADIFQSYSANHLYALSGGFQITVLSDPVTRRSNSGIGLAGSVNDNGRGGSHWPSRFPANRSVCLAPHNERGFSWSMVTRQPSTDQGRYADRDRNRDRNREKARAAQRDWEPAYYARWREIDKDCR